jgi:hypothetical protein
MDHTLLEYLNKAMEQYTGNIYWTNVTNTADKLYELTFSKIERISFGNDYDFIQFFIPARGEIVDPYTIVLENLGKKFKQITSSYTVECELFKSPNSHTCILYGTWNEDKKYTWWAIINATAL